MSKKLALISLLISGSALASLAPLVPLGNNRMTEADGSDWLTAHVGSVGLTLVIQPRLGEDSVLPLDLKRDPLFEAGAPFSSQSLQIDNPLSEPPAISGETMPPGKMAFLVIILIGGIIRFFTSETFFNILRDVYSPLAPY